MIRKKKQKHYLVTTFSIIYALLFTLVIPTQIFAEKFPANSIFNRNIAKAEQTENPQIDKSFGNIPVYFEENRGQFDKRVKYFARGTRLFALFDCERKLSMSCRTV